MKAAFFEKHGGPEVFRVGDQPAPVLQEGQALIRVEACGLNHLDIWIRQGSLGFPIPLPHWCGSEIVGKVVEYRGQPQPVPVGTRVLVATGIYCGDCRFCRAHRESLCKQFQIVGLQNNGGYAEVAAAPSKNLIPVNDRFSPAEWAAVPLVFMTAWHMLKTRAMLEKGETVLIHAAGSGVGSAAVQLAKHFGARVITTVGSDEKVAKAKALGADHVIQYKKEDFVKEVAELTQGEGVDVVFEHIGPDTWTGSLKALSKGGRLVTCGSTSGPEVTMSMRFLFARELTIHGCYMGSRFELDEVLGILSKGAVHPVVHRTFPLEKTPDAHAAMESRAIFGKLVLTI